MQIQVRVFSLLAFLFSRGRQLEVNTTQEIVCNIFKTRKTFKIKEKYVSLSLKNRCQLGGRYE